MAGIIHGKATKDRLQRKLTIYEEFDKSIGAILKSVSDFCGKLSLLSLKSYFFNFPVTIERRFA
jgi:hypothetical protein